MYSLLSGRPGCYALVAGGSPSRPDAVTAPAGVPVGGSSIVLLVKECAARDGLALVSEESTMMATEESTDAELDAATLAALVAEPETPPALCLRCGGQVRADVRLCAVCREAPPPTAPRRYTGGHGIGNGVQESAWPFHLSFTPTMPDPGGVVVITQHDHTGATLPAFGALVSDPAIYARFKREQEGKG